MQPYWREFNEFLSARIISIALYDTPKNKAPRHSLYQMFAVLAYYLAVYPEVQARIEEDIDESMDGK